MAERLAAGDTTRTLIHQGRERSYLVHVPPGYDPARPTPVALVFHDDSDRHAPYDGGVGPESLTSVDFASVEDTIGFWVEHNHRSLEPQIRTWGSIRHTVYTGCDLDARVERYTVVGGLPAWSGGQAGWLGGDRPTQEISATDLMWEFFMMHTRP